MQTETATYRLTSGVAEATLTSPASRDCLLAGGRPVIGASLQGDVVAFSCATADFVQRQAADPSSRRSDAPSEAAFEH